MGIIELIEENEKPSCRLQSRIFVVIRIAKWQSVWTLTWLASRVVESKIKMKTREHTGPSEGGVLEVTATLVARSYLVDPASSRMLVSKIKPCM